MRAAVLTRYGDVDALELREMPEPSPGGGSVKVRIAASSINPIDWKIRSGAARAIFIIRTFGFRAMAEIPPRPERAGIIAAWPVQFPCPNPGRCM